MDNHKKVITANTPKKLTIKDLKKIIGGLSADTMCVCTEDKKGNRIFPQFTE